MSSTEMNPNMSEYMNTYTVRQIRAFHITQLTVSIISVIIGGLGLVLWVRMDARRRVVFRLKLLLGLILWDFLKAVCYFCIGASRLGSLNELLNPRVRLGQDFCDGFGFVTAVCAYNSDWLILCLAIHNAVMIFLPKLSRTYRRRVTPFRSIIFNIKRILTLKLTPTIAHIFHSETAKAIYISEGGVFRIRWYIGVVFFSCSFIVSGLVFVDHGHYNADFACTVPVYPIWKRLINNMVFKYFNVISIMLIYSTICVYLALKFRKIKREKEKIYKIVANTTGTGHEEFNLDSNLQMDLMNIAKVHSRSSEERLHVAAKEVKGMMLYPLGYCFIWMPTIVSQIFYIHPGKQNPFALRLIRSLTLPLSCCVDTLIFMITEKPWNFITTKFEVKGARPFKDEEPYYTPQQPQKDITTTSTDDTSGEPELEPASGTCSLNSIKKVEVESENNVMNGFLDSCNNTLVNSSRRPSSLPSRVQPLNSDELDFIQFLQTGPSP